MTDPNTTKENEAETPDEWTVLADSYTSVLVPSCAPIYDAAADYFIGKKKVLDFGCGPGEPTLTIVVKNPSIDMVGIDSSKIMVEIATKRTNEDAKDRVQFFHVPRDVTMEKLAETAGNKFDAVVSAFVIHYVEFPRRVELVSQFLKMSPELLLLAWGDQSKVGWLRAIKIFGIWKGDISKDICKIEIGPEDNGKIETPTGSFTLCREDAFKGIVDQVEGSRLASFDTKSITLHFSSVKTLLNFLPMPTNGNDIKAMWKLLRSWTSNEVSVGDGPDQSISFPTDVVFCQIARSSKRNSDEDRNPPTKYSKSDSK